ncbi:50S ribosomal protein L4 [Verrucomicrobiota bacterium]
MSKLKIYDIKGSAVGDFDVADNLLVLNRGEQAVHDVVVAIRAGRRAGTASVLRKGEVAGSNKKPWRQKGTGRARAGYRQSPVWRGGSVAFGPHPRSYAKKTNKKLAQLAFKRAFSDKISSGAVRVLDQVLLQEIKTKQLFALLKLHKINLPALLILDEIDKNIALSASNIPNFEVVKAGDVNVYQLVRYPLVIVNKAGMEELIVRLKGKQEGGSQ